MGDRGNIVIDEESGQSIWLYTHWGGSELPETLRAMRERSGFAGTSASLFHLLQTWADVLEGKAGVGWAGVNRADLENEREQ